MLDYEFSPQINERYIENVWKTLPEKTQRTVFLASSSLSERLGCLVVFACETFQHTGSFKFRSAYNLLSDVPQHQIVASSSGNFGQAIAYACQILHKSCTIIMPKDASSVKIASIYAYGGKIEFADTIRDIDNHINSILEKQENTFYAQSSDYRVIAGNSTLGREIMEFDLFDTILAPVGSGGLCSGLIVARDYLRSAVEIVGVEPLAANDATRSLRSGQLLANPVDPISVADGARALQLAPLNWKFIRQGIADIIEVDETLIIDALRAYFFNMNLKVEPTAALTLAALLNNAKKFTGKKVCCIVSGANVESSLYARYLHDKVSISEAGK